MATVLPRSLLLGADVHFVLRLEYAGRVMHFAALPLTVYDSADGPFEVLDGLGDVEWEERLDLGDEPGEQSVAISVLLPLDVAELIADGHDLGTATGELSRWIEGTAWEDRQVLVTGVVSEPTYGSEDEAVDFSLVSSGLEDGAEIPDAAAVVTETTWPGAPERSLGRIYPLAWGVAGLVGARMLPGSPAPVVDSVARTLVLCDGWSVEASVNIANAGDLSTWVSVATARTTDGLGRRVTTCTVPLVGIVWADTDDYWVSWVSAGGTPSARLDGPLTEAGDVLAHLLALTGVGVDTGRTTAAAAQLSGIKLAGYIDERVSVWEYFTSHITPILPVTIASSADGLYPIVWRFGATEQDAVCHLDIDEGDGDRNGPVTYTDRTEVRNEITLRWALDAEADEHTEVSTLTGDASVTRSGRVSTSDRARVSLTRYGLRSETIETDLIYDATSAGRVLAWMIEARALLSRIIEYDVPTDLAFLQLGDVVTLTDSELHLAEQLCLVLGLGDAGDGLLTVTLRTLER